MDDTSRKSALIDLIERTRATEHAFWDELSQAKRSTQGTADHWSAKDVAAHIIVGNDQLAADLEAATRGDAPPERIADFNEANRRIFEANRERPWEDLLEYEEKVSARLVAAVSGLPDEMLNDPERFEWTNGRPLWWRVGFTVCFHALDHLSKLHLEWGESDRAQLLQERIVHDMRPLDDSDGWQGTITYNLACFYALSDQPGSALEELRRAFELNPWLIDWSKEDSDLDSLRELADFQALYETND